MSRIIIFFSLLLSFSPDLFAQNIESETVYFAVLIDGKKSGYGQYSRTVKDERVYTKEGYELSMNRGEVMLQASMWETCIETLAGEPVGFETGEALGAMSVESKGTYHSEGYFDVQIKTAGMQQQRKVSVPEGALMPEGLRIKGALLGLVQGRQLNVKLFTPSILQVIDAEVIVGQREKVDLLGRVVELTRVDTTIKMASGSVPSISYVNDKQIPQKIVMTVMNMNIEMIACDQAYAMSANDPPELVAKTVLQSPKPLGNIKQLPALRYRLRGKTKTPLTLPNDRSQSLVADGENHWVLTVNPQRIDQGTTLPYSGKNPQALQALKASSYMQNDHPEIMALAKRVIGKTTDSGLACQKIEKFVYDYIQEKSLSVGWASAVEVARSREGDCSEHATLAATLCQAVGIPARIAIGYIYVPEFSGHQNVFGGHAWTQVYINDQWFALDATRAPNGYTSAHITCTTGNGDPGSFFDMATAGSQFKIISIDPLPSK